MASTEAKQMTACVPLNGYCFAASASLEWGDSERMAPVPLPVGMSFYQFRDNEPLSRCRDRPISASTAF